LIAKDDLKITPVSIFFHLGIQNVKLTLDKLHISVDADGTAQTMSQLFQTSFVNHKYQDHVFYAPKTAPLIPTQIKPTILSITGKDLPQYVAHSYGYDTFQKQGSTGKANFHCKKRM
jgi:hypothetical protein